MRVTRDAHPASPDRKKFSDPQHDEAAGFNEEDEWLKSPVKPSFFP